MSEELKPCLEDTCKYCGAPPRSNCRAPLVPPAGLDGCLWAEDAREIARAPDPAPCEGLDDHKFDTSGYVLLPPTECQKRLTAARAEIERLKDEAAREDQLHDNTIEQRDAAEEAFSQAYFLIFGQSPKWSNLFGHVEALKEIDDAQRLLRDEAQNLRVSNEMLRGAQTAHRALIAQQHAALVVAQKVAGEAADEWDNAPNGMKAGRLLLALSGRLPKYRGDIDSIATAIAAHNKMMGGE